MDEAKADDIQQALDIQRAMWEIRCDGAFAVGFKAGLEAAARVAKEHETPFARAYPEDDFLSKLEHVVLQAVFSAPRADNQPERHIAESVLRFLKTGLRADDVVWQAVPCSEEIATLPIPPMREGGR